MPGITLDDFLAKVKQWKSHDGKALNDRNILTTQYFLSTYRFNGVDYILDDSLIRETLARPYGVTTGRLYLFALLLNMPGPGRRESAESQNAFVKEELYQDEGWLSSALTLAKVKKWVTANVSLETDVTITKYSTNLLGYFEQCEFGRSTKVVETYYKNWTLLALRLVFERLKSLNPSAPAEELAAEALSREIHKLLGAPQDWFEDLLDGAALFFINQQFAVFEPAQTKSAGQVSMAAAERRDVTIKQIVRAGGNKRKLEKWYGQTCQVCGLSLAGGEKKSIVEGAHIRALGSPDHGPDDVGNMLLLCPNHHKQFDRKVLWINPKTKEIVAAHGSHPEPLAKLHIHREHAVDEKHLAYHQKKCGF